MACLCCLLAGCDLKTTNKREVFDRYFHNGAPTNAIITQASDWEARDGPLLDAWELILDAELPHDFLVAVLPVTPGATPLPPQSVDLYFGETNTNDGVVRALADCPPWFKPKDSSRFSIALNNVKLSFNTGFAAVAFADPDPTNRFELWVSDHGCSRLFIDRQTRHIYAHNKFP